MANDNKKAAQASTHTASNFANDRKDFTPANAPYKSWLDLPSNVKPSHQHDLKKSWKRKQLGGLLTEAMLLALILTGMLLMAERSV